MKRLALLGAVAALLIPAAAQANARLDIRGVDVSDFPQMRVTVVAPQSTRPRLLEDGRAATVLKARQLGSAGALLLAVDNSTSMQGRPLREAKRAARAFLLGQHGEGSAFGLLTFGHEAVVLTGRNESRAAVARAIGALAPDVRVGTALYDAVVSSTAELRRMSSGARVLVLLTDGQDVGSTATLAGAIAAAKEADVLVYAIGAGRKADITTLRALTEATGGRVFSAGEISKLSATYAALGRELARTWQFSYLSAARPGDRVTLAVTAGGAKAHLRLTAPGSDDYAGPLPAGLLRNTATGIAIVALAALLLGAAGAIFVRRRRTPEVRRLLEPHLKRKEEEVEAARPAMSERLVVWTEDALNDLPGYDGLVRSLERSGLKLRLGHVPYVALGGALLFGAFAALTGRGPVISIVLMLIGLAAPFAAFRIASVRRAKAFDRQLPDMLATIASTMRAGHGLRTALRTVADDGSPPASEEMTRVLGEERLGRPLDEAIGAMCARIGSQDLEYVATAINVQTQAGGSLATLFDTLSDTVRERQRHMRKVRALTSMGRVSAMILTSLPFCLAGLMTLISPGYMAPFYKTSTGQVLIGFCLVSMAIGAFLLKRIVNVRY